MDWLRKLLRKWLEIDQLELRMVDVERHFVTKRDESGKAIETLADVPLEQRKERLAPSLRGMNIQQRKQWLEETDGGRALATQRRN